MRPPSPDAGREVSEARAERSAVRGAGEDRRAGRTGRRGSLDDDARRGRAAPRTWRGSAARLQARARGAGSRRRRPSHVEPMRGECPSPDSKVASMSARRRSVPTSVSARTSGTRRGDAGRCVSRPSTSSPASASRRVSGSLRDRSVGLTDQPEFRNAAVAVDVAGGSADAEADALRPPRVAQGHRARGWPPGTGAMGPARARPRPAAVRPPPHRCRSAAGRAVDRCRRRPGQSRETARGPAPRTSASGCSSWPPWPTSLRGSSRPAGPRRSTTRRRVVAAAEPPGTVRVVGEWDGSAGRWVPTEHPSAKPSGGPR